jgi:DNA-binding transcriptional LysR family regulator
MSVRILVRSERTEAVRNLRAFAQAGETELHVGYSLTPSAHILSSAARSFQRAMPNVHVKLHDWSNEEIAVGLRDERLIAHSHNLRSLAAFFFFWCAVAAFACFCTACLRVAFGELSPMTEG